MARAPLDRAGASHCPEACNRPRRPARATRHGCAVNSEGVMRTVALLLNDAQEALEAGDWETARTRIATVLSLDPDNAQARRIAASALEAQVRGSHVLSTSG